MRHPLAAVVLALALLLVLGSVAAVLWIVDHNSGPLIATAPIVPGVRLWLRATSTAIGVGYTTRRAGPAVLTAVTIPIWPVVAVAGVVMVIGPVVAWWRRHDVIAWRADR